MFQRHNLQPVDFDDFGFCRYLDPREMRAHCLPPHPAGILTIFVTSEIPKLKLPIIFLFERSDIFSDLFDIIIRELYALLFDPIDRQWHGFDCYFHFTHFYSLQRIHLLILSPSRTLSKILKIEISTYAVSELLFSSRRFSISRLNSAIPHLFGFAYGEPKYF